MVKVTMLIMSYIYVYTGLHIMCFCDKIDCFQVFTSQDNWLGKKIVYPKAAWYCEIGHSELDILLVKEVHCTAW